MPGIISGEGLGLFNNQLAGLDGQGSLGQAGTNIAVNAATGNLILRQSDQVLVGLGIDSAVVRTYNSQGHLNDDNGDNFRFSFNQRLAVLTGSANSAGSTITRIAGDGSETVFSYQSSGPNAGAYFSSDGDGAHDTLIYNGSTQQWTYTEGSSQRQEQYDWIAGAGKLTAQSDADGNTKTYAYHANGFINQINDASGQIIDIIYAGNNATEVRTTSEGITQTLVTYQYDTSNRLIQAIIDLQPSDSTTYATSYTYDGVSNRVASVTQSDGTAIAFSYDASNRIETVTDGNGNVTTYSYTSNSMTATDALGNQTTYHFDLEGQVTQIQRPGPGAVPVSSFY